MRGVRRRLLGLGLPVTNGTLTLPVVAGYEPTRAAKHTDSELPKTRGTRRTVSPRYRRGEKNEKNVAALPR